MNRAIADLQVQKYHCRNSCSDLRAQLTAEISSVQQCLSHSPKHKVWTCRVWLQKLLYLLNSPPVWEILEISFFLSLSPRIAACLSWRLRMLPACPQICRNFWSGVLVCHWAEQSVKNKFVCERCFLKSFKALQKTSIFQNLLN